LASDVAQRVHTGLYAMLFAAVRAMQKKFPLGTSACKELASHGQGDHLTLTPWRHFSKTAKSRWW